MKKTAINYKCPAYYNLDMTCRAHGWKNLAPFSWDDAAKTLSFAMIVEQDSVDVSVQQNHASIDVVVTSRKPLGQEAITRAAAMIRRSLGIDLDIVPVLRAAEKAGPEYVRLIKNGAGRLLRSPTLWEDAAKTLFTTNCTWALTQKMCIAVCSDAFTEPAPSGTFPFPCPERLCCHSEKQLKAMLPVGYRAGYLKELGDRFSKDPDIKGLEVNGHDYDQADQIVRRSKGFADYACSQLLVLAGFYDEIPVDTTAVARMMEEAQKMKDQEESKIITKQEDDSRIIIPGR